MLKIRLVYTFCIYFCDFTCYFFNFRVSKIEKRFILILRTTTMQYKTEKDIIKSIKEFEKKTNNKKLQLIKDNTIKNLYLCLRATKHNTNINFIFRYKLNSKIYTISLNTSNLSEARQVAKDYNNILQSQEFKQYNKDNNKDLKDYISIMNEKHQSQTLHTTIDKWLATKSHLRQSTMQAYKKNVIQ